MFNPHKPASPFAQMGRPEQAGSGQYGGNATPNGNAWGQQFMQQYGAPPGQMRDEWNAFRSENGFGGSAEAANMGGINGAPQMPQQQYGGGINPMSGWLNQRPQMGGGVPDRRAMMMAWLQQRPRGLLGG